MNTHNDSSPQSTAATSSAQAYLDIAGVMLGALDLKGTITLMNKKGHELLGYPEGELLGKNWFNTCLPTANREEVAAVFQQQMNGDFPPLEFYENSVLTSAGDERLVTFHNTPLYDGDRLCGILFSGEDITRRKQAEKELQESEERLYLAMMIKNEGIWDWNLVTQQVDFDQRYYTMAGYDPGDFANNLEEFQKRVHPEDVDCVMSTAEQYFAGQIERFQAEFRFKRKDGSWMWIQGRGQIVERDEKGIPLRFIGTHSDITERKRAEVELRTTEENLRITLDSIGDAVISTDTDGRIVLFNPVAQKLTGFSLQEAVGRDIYEVFNIVKGGTNEPAENPVKRVLEEGKVVGLANHTVLIAKDGSEYQIADSGAPIRNSAGEITGAVLVFRDVTETYHQQEALRESEEKISSILRSAPIGIGQVTNRVFNYVNDQFARMVGYTVSELTGQPSRTCYPSDEEFERVGRYKYEEIKEKGTGTIETVMQKKDGTRIDVILSSTPVDQSDWCKGVTFSALDITERKQLELEQEKLLAALHQTKENIVITDTEARIEYVNPAFETLTGYSAQEAIGEDPRILQSGEQDPDFYREMWGRLTSGQSWQGRFVNKKKDGTRYTEEASISPVIDLQGRTTHYVAVKKDISDQLELEQQLRQKYKMEAVGTMAGGIAHNFNNNLSVILGNVELSQLKNNNPEVSELLKNAKVGIMRSRDLVSQIMSYSRKGTQSLAPLQLPLIIDETLKLLGSTIPTTVELSQTISPDSDQTTINADASQIQEILLNLYGNAVHAMEEKGRLDITLDVVDLTNKEFPNPDQHQPGRYARITIQDSGCGMTAEVKEKIFDPFFTTKGIHEGTGMGLSTVQGIIEQHNGLIKVESSVGQGTTFELYFPVIDQTQAEQPTLVKADIPRGSEKILFVDDDEMLAKLGKLQLEELGYQVSTMTESPEALKLFAANADYFDLVITDQTMPDLSGKELIAELLKIRPDIPTIICTGYSSQVSKEEAEKLGAKAFVMKPLNLQELAQTVRRVLDGEEER